MSYVALWILAVCLPASALAAYLALRTVPLPRPRLYVLTALLAPVLLLGAVVAALIVSTLLSAAFETPADTDDPLPTRETSVPNPGPERPERTASPSGTTPEPTGSAPPSTASPGASPMSPAASPSASPAASSASPAAGE